MPKFSEIITMEAKAIMYGVANETRFDKREINRQLAKINLTKGQVANHGKN